MFLDTLGYACAGVKDGVSYVQLALGNMLLGNPAQIVLVLWGRGGNGKSTVLEVVKAALGSGKTGYATASVMEMWQRSIDFATVHLTGKRAAIAAEFSPGLGWNESLVKAISGGDTQLSRDLHQSYAEQRVSCMPIFAFNDPPAFKRLNEAMLRRLSVIAGGMLPGSPNNRATIIEKDETMKARIIRDELPAVLRWMLDGAERVLAGESALRRPDDVMRGLEMLIGEQDRILGWIAANLIRSKDGAHRVTLAECVEILKGQIARDEDEETQRRLLPHIDARQFGNRLRAAGYEVTRGTGGVAVVKGVKMRGRLYDDAAVLDFAQARRNRVDWS
jgi:putative DNA primase/helicase